MAFGNNFSISINGDSKEETDKLFNGLSSDGKITMPWQELFGALISECLPINSESIG